MAWGSTDIIPGGMPDINSYNSLGAGGVLNDAYCSFSSGTSQGGLFDATAMTGLTLYINANPSLAQGVSQWLKTVTPTVISHTSSGVRFKLTAAQLATIFDGMPTDTISVSAVGTDGTTPLLMGAGRMISHTYS